MIEIAPLVFVVEDDPSMRAELVRLLDSAGYRCESFAGADDLLPSDPTDDPACLVLDTELSGLSGLELQAALVARGSVVPIVFISDQKDVALAVRAMKAGAMDFLTKPYLEVELLQAIRLAVARHAETERGMSEVERIRELADSLSPREREVMSLVVAGMLNKCIGARLGITEKTVKVHRGQVMRKMAAGSLPDLVRMVEKIEPITAPYALTHRSSFPTRTVKSGVAY